MALTPVAAGRDDEAMTKNIIVGFDGGSSARFALDWAIEEADLRGAALHLVRCFDVPGFDPVMGYALPSVIARIGDDAQAAVDVVAASVRARHPGLQVTAEAAPTAPRDALLNGRDTDDLVVVGASRHVDRAAFWLGSTPRRLIRHSPCPVVVVRTTAPTIDRAARIVVGVDGSDSARAALLWAADEAERRGALLVVVHAWTFPYGTVTDASQQARDVTEVDAACLLQAEVEQVRRRFGCEVVAELIEGGAAAALLSTTGPGSLLVVGSRGRGALASGIFGSTTTSALEHSSVPVVVVPET